MGATTEIAWTDSTFSPWRGCQHAVGDDGVPHPACDFCYAEAMAKRNPTMLGEWGPEGTRVCAAPAYWRQPLKWNAAAEAAGERRRVFCASISDVFEDWHGPIFDHHEQTLFCCPHCRHIAPDDWVGGFHEQGDDAHRCPKCGGIVRGELPPATMDDLRHDLFALIDATPWLTWLLLTKRPENVRRMWAPVPIPGNLDPVASAPYGHSSRLYRKNVHIGTSISDQATADEWIPRLLECHDLCPVLFVSAEPIIGPINLAKWLRCEECQLDHPGLVTDAVVNRSQRSHPMCGRGRACPFIGQVIVGGESGPHRRPCSVEWIERIADDCTAANVAFFCKQDAAQKSGQQGRIPDHLWARKEFPSMEAVR